MKEANHERILVSVVKEIAENSDIELQSFSHDWILQLGLGDKTRHIVGYNFEINSATAHMLAADKAATAGALQAARIASVPHQLFLHPRLANYVSSNGNWDQIQAFAKKNGFPLVVKPNEGTGGSSVTKVDNGLELEQSVTRLFEKTRAIAISPYVEIEQEYRAIILDEKVLLSYAKMRPMLIGNGKASIIELLQRKSIEQSIPQSLASKALERYEGRLSDVLEEGEHLPLYWKHNLGTGAIPQIVAEEKLEKQIEALAISAANAIGIRFASVDIVQVDGQMQILEINAGIMMEHFSRHFPEERERVKQIYSAAINAMFAE